MAAPSIEQTDKLSIRFDAQSLVPAIVQDADSGQVLMMAWMNSESLDQTLRTGQATFYSRSRRKVWVKGETSGHVQQVVEVRVDCDQDTVLLRCRPRGPACHAGFATCFYRAIDGQRLSFREQPVFEPERVYGPAESAKRPDGSHPGR